MIKHKHQITKIIHKHTEGNLLCGGIMRDIEEYFEDKEVKDLNNEYSDFIKKEMMNFVEEYDWDIFSDQLLDKKPK